MRRPWGHPGRAVHRHEWRPERRRVGWEGRVGGRVGDADVRCVRRTPDTRSSPWSTPSEARRPA